MGENKSKNLTCEDEKLLVGEGYSVGRRWKRKKKAELFDLCKKAAAIRQIKLASCV